MQPQKLMDFVILPLSSSDHFISRQQPLADKVLHALKIISV